MAGVEGVFCCSRLAAVRRWTGAKRFKRRKRTYILDMDVLVWLVHLPGRWACAVADLRGAHKTLTYYDSIKVRRGSCLV